MGKTWCQQSVTILRFISRNQFNSIYVMLALHFNENILSQFMFTVKPALSGHSKRSQKLVFKADYRLMQVKVLQNVPRGAFYNTFDLHKDTICHKDLCFVYFRVTA